MHPTGFCRMVQQIWAQNPQTYKLMFDWTGSLPDLDLNSLHNVCIEKGFSSNCPEIAT